MNLILIKTSELKRSDKRCVTLDKADARAKHIVGHLRKRSGDDVSVGVIGGGRGVATVRLVEPSSESSVHADGNGDGSDDRKKVGSDGSIVLELSFDGTISGPSYPEMTLVLAIPQPKRLKALWSVVASMGVIRIVLIRAQLSPYGEHCKSSRFVESAYRSLIEEGMAQGAHVRPVVVDVDVDNVVCKEMLEKLGLVAAGDKHSACRSAKVFLDCGDESGVVVPPARDVVIRSCSADISCSTNDNPEFDNRTPLNPPSAVLAVGPERGWTDSEAKLFQEVGFSMATLGSSILRVDTAVVAGLAIVSAALDECYFDDANRVNVANGSKRKRTE